MLKMNLWTVRDRLKNEPDLTPEEREELTKMEAKFLAARNENNRIADRRQGFGVRV